MVWPIAPRLHTCTSFYCTEYCRQFNTVGNILILYYNIITLYYYIIYYNIILWGHRHICGPSLTETALCGAYLYKSSAPQSLTIRGAQILSVLSLGCINFIQCYRIFFFSLRKINAYHFACTEQRASDSRDDHRSLQHGGSPRKEFASCYPSGSKNLEVPFRFWKVCWPLACVYGPGVDSASNRNEYQGHFLG